jgi:hypothetical protein
MARSSSKTASVSGRDGAGQYARAAGKPRKPPRRPSGKRTYGLLRGVAMRLIRHLENALPPLKQTDGQDAAIEDKVAGEEIAAQQNESDQAAKRPPLNYDRLLGRNDGVVDGFKTLAELIVRLFEMEHGRLDAANSDFEFNELDEEELDRRLTAELDRLARNRRSADAD